MLYISNFVIKEINCRTIILDFKNLDGVWKLKSFCITSIELILNFFFVLVSFVFILNLSLILIFRQIKPI